jgi:hypothetical protein
MAPCAAAFREETQADTVPLTLHGCDVLRELATVTNCHRRDWQGWRLEAPLSARVNANRGGIGEVGGAADCLKISGSGSRARDCLERQSHPEPRSKYGPGRRPPRRHGHAFRNHYRDPAALLILTAISPHVAGWVTASSCSTATRRRENRAMRTGSVIRITIGASIMPPTTTMASGFCT